MNPYLIYIKLGAAALLLAIVAGGSYHFGGMASRTALERDHAAMASAATQALLAQRKQAEAESARINKVVSDYEKAPIDPVTVGLSHRVFVYANRADCPVSGTPSVAPGTQTPAPVPIGPSGVERALGDLVAACSQDAAQLSAVIQLAP